MKHGILLTDEFFGNFCIKKVITEEGRYSILEYLNNDEDYGLYRFLQFEPPTVLEYIKNSKIMSMDNYSDLYYWLTRGDINEPEFRIALQQAWMILREMENCRKCEGENE